MARPVVHRVADRAVAAGGGEPAVDEHDLTLGQPLDLVQHVRADDHRAALLRRALEQGDEVQRAAPGRRRSSGSSSTSTCGSVTSAAATFVRWRMPLLNPSTRRSATSSIPTVSSARSTARRVGDAVQVGDVADELAGGEHRRHRFVLRHQRERRWTSRSRARIAAERRVTVPWFRPMRPVIARMSVVLPAPLGPSRPVTPGPNEQLSSDSATFWPNHTETSRDLDGGVGPTKRRDRPLGATVGRAHASSCR